MKLTLWKLVVIVVVLLGIVAAGVGLTIYGLRGLHADVPATTGPATQASAIADPGDGIPPLEHDRAKNETNPQPVGALPIAVNADFECSTPVTLETISPTHLKVTIVRPGQDHWFFFRLKGVAGKTVRIDIAKASVIPAECPVYVYAQTLDDPALYAAPFTPADAVHTSLNGTSLPTTDGQSWHYMENNWTGEDGSFCTVMHFDADSVYICQRIPYPPSYAENWFKRLATNPLAQVVELGTTPGGAKQRLIKISAGDKAEQQNPCVLMYAGDHPTEPDAMWMAQGAVDYLLSDAPTAKQLREKMTFLIIPMLDPDAVAQPGARTVDVEQFFNTRKTIPQSLDYVNWFQKWVDSGKRLDVAFDLGSFDYDPPHVTCEMAESQGERGKYAEALHGIILQNLRSQYDARPEIAYRGVSGGRMNGFLYRAFGTFALAYWIDAQEPTRHLNLGQVEKLGVIFSDSCGEFFTSPDGIAALATVNERRKIRDAQWKKSTIPRAGSGNAVIDEMAVHDIVVDQMPTDPPETTYNNR